VKTSRGCVLKLDDKEVEVLFKLLGTLDKNELKEKGLTLNDIKKLKYIRAEVEEYFYNFL